MADASHDDFLSMVPGKTYIESSVHCTETGGAKMAYNGSGTAVGQQRGSGSQSL